MKLVGHAPLYSFKKSNIYTSTSKFCLFVQLVSLFSFAPVIQFGL